MSARTASEARHRAWVTAIKLLVSAALLWLLISRVGVGSLVQLVQHIDVPWVLLALAASLVAAVVQTEQWRALLAALGLRRSRARCLRVVYVGLAFNTVLPSAIGGDVVRSVMIAEEPHERVAAAATVVLQRLLNFPGMVALLLVGLVLTLNDPNATRVRPVAAAAAAAGILLLVMCASPLLGTIARLPVLARHRIGRMASKLLSALDSFRGRGPQLAAALGRGVIFWTLVVINQYAFMRGVGIDAPLPLAALVIITVTALTLLPVSINGFGLREGGFAAFLAVGGIATASQAVALGLLISTQTVLLALIGIACMWSRGRRWRPVPGGLEAVS